MKQFALIFILALICISGACNRRPEHVLSDSEMESLLTDLILADAYEQSSYSRNLPDSVRRTLADAVLRQHGVDQATLDSTFAWYSRNLDDYYKLYARVDKRIAKMSKNVNGNVDQNLNDIWQLPVRIQLSPMAKSEAFVFELPAEAVTKGDKIEWYFRLNNDIKADVALGIDYTNGATSISRRELTSSKNVSMTLVVDTALSPRRIFGLVRVQRRDLPLWLDSIRLTKTPFDSTTYETFRNPRFMMPPKRRLRIEGSVAPGISSSPEAVQSMPITPSQTPTKTNTSSSSASMPKAPAPPPPPPAKKAEITPALSRPGM